MPPHATCPTPERHWPDLPVTGEPRRLPPPAVGRHPVSPPFPSSPPSLPCLFPTEPTVELPWRVAMSPRSVGVVRHPRCRPPLMSMLVAGPPPALARYPSSTMVTTPRHGSRSCERVAVDSYLCRPAPHFAGPYATCTTRNTEPAILAVPRHLPGRLHHADDTHRRPARLHIIDLHHRSPDPPPSPRPAPPSAASP